MVQPANWSTVFSMQKQACECSAQTICLHVGNLKCGKKMWAIIGELPIPVCLISQAAFPLKREKIIPHLISK